MVLDPMPAEDLLVLLDLIEPALDDWRLKRRIVQRIGAVPGGDWFGAPEAAPLVGKSRGWCRQVLGMLDDDRVITRYGTEANGRRIWCEVNPDWEQWRRVPWREDRHAIRRELAYVRQRRQEDPLVRFIAFSGHSHPRYTQLARVVGGRKRDELPNGAPHAQHRGWMGAENAVTDYRYPASRFEPWDHPRPGGEGRGSDPQETAMLAVADRLYTLFSDRSKDLSLERDQPLAQQPDSDERVDHAALVAKAIKARTGCPVFGNLANDRIPTVVAEWTGPVLLEAIKTVAPGDLDAPRYLTKVEQHLFKQQQAAVAAARVEAEGPARDELRQLKEGLAQMAYMGHELPAIDVARHKELCGQLGEDLELPPVVDYPAPLEADLSDDLTAKIAATKAKAANASTSSGNGGVSAWS